MIYDPRASKNRLVPERHSYITRLGIRGTDMKLASALLTQPSDGGGSSAGKGVRVSTVRTSVWDDLNSEPRLT